MARRRYIVSPRDLWSGWPQCANQPEGGAEPLVSANEPTQLLLNGCEACGTANVPSIACYPCLHGEPLRGGTGGSKGDHGGVHERTELIEQLSAIHERSVAHASRQVSNTLSRKFSCQTTHPPHSQVNQVNAKRAAKKTVKQTRLSSVDNGAERTAVVNVITSGDM